MSNIGILAGLNPGTWRNYVPSGETFSWIFTLPYPANRASGGADLPIGTALLWQGPSANPAPLMLGQISLADPNLPWASQGEEDKHCQVFLQNMVAYGTASQASGSTGVTVAHGLPGTPNAFDFNLVMTNTPSTNPQWASIQNIGATTFDIIVKASSTTTPATFAWSCKPFPGSSLFQLLGTGRPWNWAAGHSIGLLFQYEARR
jgi:hypothetical protein